MDCSTARMLLEFNRPHAPELDSAEGAQLERHLAQCDTCRVLEKDSHRFDEAVGATLRNIEVPERLHSHILAKLDSERADYYRRWYAHGIRIAAAAALVLLAVWAVFYWRDKSLPQVNLEVAWQHVNQYTYAPPSPDQVEEHFQRLGHPIAAPRDLNYAFLVDMQLVEFQGEQVPQLFFVRNDDDLGIHAHAKVLILPSKTFDLKSLPKEFASPTGYRYQMKLRHKPGQSCAYLIVYTGKDMSWLTAPNRSG